MPKEADLFRVSSQFPVQGKLEQRTQIRSSDNLAFKSSHVAILMGTYNGERFLHEQLASIERQTHHNWTLYVSDDGSKDSTHEQLKDVRVRWGETKLNVFNGPQRGFVANFLSIACNDEIDADFFAWCDQDDIWCEDKLEAALKWLKTIPDGTPALYCGRTEMICESGLYAGKSPLFVHPPSFANALVQSIGGGNTMVFNQAARALLQEAGCNVIVPSHDWWAYQLISGAGGAIHYDPVPKVLYRQHGENLVGANSSWSARFVRIQMVYQGRFREWNEQTIRALESMSHRLDKKNQVSLMHFDVARSQSLFARILSCFRAGIYRQTLFGNLGLILAIMLKKF